MNKRVSTDFPYEKQADFDRRIDCRSYESPRSSRESPRVPYTQPRRCPWSFNGPDQRKSEEHFRRKLPFVQCPEGENRQSLVNRYPCNYSSVTCASPKLLLPSPHRDWRGKFVDNLEKAKKGPGEPFVRNENRSRSCLFVYDGNLKPTEECDLASDSTSTADTTKTKTVSSMEPVQSCVRPETVKTCDPQTGCRKTIELSTPEPKKCWADLVEEDEQEPENWREQFSIGLADKGGCNDENVDIKVVSETPLVEKSCQELQSLDLEAGGYFTQPDKVNQKVKRSLCFDQRQEENQCTSPFKIKAFDFEGH